jgi:uncharacterized protein YggU (UPF0235/DUF167 family)
MAGARIAVRVQSKASHVGVTVVETGHIIVKVNAHPERGKANALVVAPSDLKIAQGNISRDKVLVMEGLTQDEVMSRIQNGS